MADPVLNVLAGALRLWIRSQCDSILSLIHISEPTRQAEISYAVFCLKKKNETYDETLVA